MSVFSSIGELFNFQNAANASANRGDVNTLLMSAGAGAGLGVASVMAYKVGNGKGGLGSAIVGAAASVASTWSMHELGFTRAQQIVFGIGVPAIGLLLGLLKRKGPEKALLQLDATIDPGSLAGKSVLPIAASAVLTILGVNMLSSSGPGGWSASAHLSEVNQALSTATGQSPEAWNNDPTGAVFIQHDVTLTRVVVVNPAVTAANLVTQGGAVNKTGTTATSDPTTSDPTTSDPYVGVQVISYEKGKEPASVSALTPSSSYVPMLLSADNSNPAASAAIQEQNQLVSAADSAAVSGPTDAQGLLALASQASHSGKPQ